MKTTGRMLAALTLALCAVAVFAASCADDLPLTITTDVGTVAIKSVENSGNGSDETETVELCDVGDTLEIVTGQFIPRQATGREHIRFRMSAAFTICRLRLMP
ncbi:MAG: hypothetical protein LUI61_04835 [Firmicutes bacterium]|nr:hypothetical protein [Bacillota bacterium]